LITILAFVFVLLVLVFIHELGHFVAARSVGVKVLRLSLGFPPRLFSFSPTSSGWIFKIFFIRRNDSGKLTWAPVIEKVIARPPSKVSETEYCVALVPIGGYVKMAGAIDESMDEKVTGAPDELSSKNKLQQIWVMSAGVLMNILLAILVFSIVVFIRGVPEGSTDPVVVELEQGLPAAEAGIQVGDRILHIDGQSISTWEEMTRIIHNKPLEMVTVGWERDGKIMSAQIETVQHQVMGKCDVQQVGLIGIGRKIEIRKAGLFESLGLGTQEVEMWLCRIITLLGKMITRQASLKDIGGPILIAQLAGQQAQAGFIPLIYLMAIISVNLALINILPIPALDGGHILILLIEGISRRELSMKVRMVIQQVGMTLLLLLILVIMYNDLARLFFR